MAKFIKPTENPFGIAVQSYIYWRMRRYSDMLTKNAFQEMEFGSLNSQSVVTLSDSLKGCDDGYYLNSVCLYYYTVKHELDEDLVFECGNRIWDKGWEQIEKTKNINVLVDEEMEILSRSSQKVRKTFMENKDVMEFLVEVGADLDRIEQYLETTISKDKEVIALYSCVFGTPMEDEEFLKHMLGETNHLFNNIELKNVGKIRA